MFFPNFPISIHYYGHKVNKYTMGIGPILPNTDNVSIHAEPNNDCVTVAIYLQIRNNVDPLTKAFILLILGALEGKLRNHTNNFTCLHIFR